MPESASPTTSGNQAGQRILILFAHPSPDRSEVNIPLAQATGKLPGVTLVDLYAEYPNLDIDVDREQQRLLDHDIIVFMHPLYWYSTPAILKEWQDLVLEHGFAYGSEGTALHGKIFFNALTAGGAESAYCPQGYNHFSIRELLQPMEQMALLCGMTYLPPFALFGARTAVEENRLQDHIQDWQRLVQALHENRVDIDQARDLPKLNADLGRLLEETAS
ncbi:MAG: NAD(P)H-dependent oxidoreductase [Gammaproteobacteria bacterium]|nr:NAD(P)H-dependent oxidoreductase [Gammaproteobacteria bacterium]